MYVKINLTDEQKAMLREGVSDWWYYKSLRQVGAVAKAASLEAEGYRKAVEELSLWLEAGVTLTYSPYAGQWYTSEVIVYDKDGKEVSRSSSSLGGYRHGWHLIAVAISLGVPIKLYRIDTK